MLYVPSEMEIPHYCVQLVIEIRRFLTDQISQTNNEHLEHALRAMRAACRKFLDAVQDRDIIEFGSHRGHWASWVFNSAIGELRGVFGVHLAIIASAYNLDIEDDLVVILPAEDREERS